MEIIPKAVLHLAPACSYAVLQTPCKIPVAEPFHLGSMKDDRFDSTNVSTGMGGIVCFFLL